MTKQGKTISFSISMTDEERILIDTARKKNHGRLTRSGFMVGASLQEADRIIRGEG